MALKASQKQSHATKDYTTKNFLKYTKDLCTSNDVYTQMYALKTISIQLYCITHTIQSLKLTIIHTQFNV